MFDEVELSIPIALLIELIRLVLNILIIKQRKSVRLLLPHLQRSGIEHRCTGQGKDQK